MVFLLKNYGFLLRNVNGSNRKLRYEMGRNNQIEGTKEIGIIW
jgi:hypothetical protein